ncbi:MAG TPA: tetratricopeptide repeat protein [Phenylobacterium sp.]|uniref:tetratricopeptide repeat protein n=1 Tax=Phenylobacterium sp. TaxID=1871053 RepID=UPI002D37208E|nr:tetratricopeptide repeat protein [Phenylobacterium sp.]HZZ70089.1 tetratricopeptide repeat protein [Phenylobacterium sp.]
MPLTDDIRDLIEHETTEAQQMLRQLVDALPKSVEAHLLLATSHLRRLEFGPTLTYYRETLALDPKNDEALRGIGFCLLATGDNEAALAAFRQAFKASSGAGALRFVALLCHRLGRIEEAIKAYELLLGSCQPTSSEIPFALQGLALALRDAGQPIAADHRMRQLIERFRRERILVASSLVNRNNSDDFHEWSPYADKARLAASLNARQAIDPAGRFPESFVLPRDRQALETFAKGSNAPPLYIVKPIRASGGQGISVTADLSQAIGRDDVVIQRYLDRPYLIEGRKGHCRIYCLVTSAEPLRAYVYSEGIVRIAPEPYDPSPQAAGGASMHVTNTALHLGHPGLSISQDANQDDTGSIRSLSALLRRMTADGLDGKKAFGEIKALVEWHVRLLAAEGLFARQAASAPSRAFPPKLFGLDVLIDDEGHPWLIEMQRTPAARGAPLVEKINGEMYVTCFQMTHFTLIDDATPEALTAELRSDDTARRRREAEQEFAARGKFVPLDL